MIIISFKVYMYFLFANLSIGISMLTCIDKFQFTPNKICLIYFCQQQRTRFFYFVIVSNVFAVFFKYFQLISICIFLSFYIPLSFSFIQEIIKLCNNVLQYLNKFDKIFFQYQLKMFATFTYVFSSDNSWYLCHHSRVVFNWYNEPLKCY